MNNKHYILIFFPLEHLWHKSNKETWKIYLLPHKKLESLETGQGTKSLIKCYKLDMSSKTALLRSVETNSLCTRSCWVLHHLLQSALLWHMLSWVLHHPLQSALLWHTVVIHNFIQEVLVFAFSVFTFFRKFSLKSVRPQP